MNRLAQHLALTAFALAGALSVAQAAASDPAFVGPQALSADVPSRTHQGLRARVASPLGSAAAVTAADVGDVDSFGRNLRWIGLTDMSVVLSDDCTGIASCQVLAPAPATTDFSFTDLNHITLPEKATNSLLCYWLSPLLDISYDNPTAAAVVAQLRINPTLTIDNAVLATPGLIDPTTGLPFGGSLLTGMTSQQRFQVPLPAGLHIDERKRDSAVCIQGFLSHTALVETYGLTDAQATDFFKHQTTVHLNLSGSAQYVDFASLYFGFRIIGD